MKKTLQSKLTAALFAAALSTGTGGVMSPQFANAVGSDADVTTVPQTTYGPPVWMQTTEQTETETTGLMKEGTVVTYEETTTLEGTVTTCEECTEIATTEPVYYATETPVTTTMPPTTTTTINTDELVTAGVVPIYAEAGDADYNESIDARDLTLIKQYLLNQNKARTLSGGSDPYDVNGDGKIDKNDVKALVRLLTGKPEGEPDQTTTAVTNTETTTDTTTTTFTTTPMVLYGPPKAFD